MEPTKKPAPIIQMLPCKSTQVSSFGYDPESKTLALQFHGGNEYRYFDVPHETFEALRTCDSVGKFLGASIKGKFKYERMTAGGLGRIVEKDRAA